MADEKFERVLFSCIETIYLY